MSLSMRADRVGWASAVLISLCVSASQASTQLRFEPSVTLAAGADSNVLFEQGGAGDQVARAAGRLHVRAYDRRWSVVSDLAVSALAFDDARRVVPLGEFRVESEFEATRDATIETHARIRAADDPLALAQVGLIAGRGRTLGYRTGASWQERFSREWDLTTAVSFDGVRFFDGGTAEDGDAVGLALTPRRTLSRSLAVNAAVEGRLFLQDGVLARSVAVLPGARWRVGRRQFLEGAAGPLIYDDDAGAEPMVAARVRWTFAHRDYALELSGSHDLTVPTSRGGVMAGELAEFVARYGPGPWEMRTRAGLYRSRTTPRTDTWVAGYGLEGSVFRELGAGVWIGASAMRFERLATDTEPSLDRNAAYLRLEWTGGRP